MGPILGTHVPGFQHFLTAFPLWRHIWRESDRMRAYVFKPGKLLVWQNHWHSGALPGCPTWCCWFEPLSPIQGASFTYLTTSILWKNCFNARSEFSRFCDYWSTPKYARVGVLFCIKRWSSCYDHGLRTSKPYIPILGVSYPWDCRERGLSVSPHLQWHYFVSRVSTTKAKKG